MARPRRWLLAGLLGCLAGGVPVVCSWTSVVSGQSPATPRPEPVAETRLLMEGLAAANLRGLASLLREKPAEAEAWAFARGQALLLAETGNLLLLRPPRTPAAQDAWAARAVELREAATSLARHAAARDYGRSRAALAAVANACNHCHSGFRVPFRADPFPPD